MEKLKYGTKEIIATLAGMAFFVFLEWLQTRLAGRGVLPSYTYEWVQLRVLVIAIVSTFFGSLCGVFTGLGGDLLINVIFESSISYPEVLVLGIYGLLMGMYAGRMHYPKKRYTAKDFFDFNAIQIFIGILCSMFIVPMLLLFLENVDVYEGVMIGARSAFGNSIVIGITVPPIVAIVCAVKRRRTRDRRT